MHNAKALVVVGLQWGDEGKGKIVDYLAKDADWVIRFNGGNNAGHTVVTGKKIFKFHHLPSGAVRGKKLLIAQGSVINPKVLLEEIDFLKKEKIPLDLSIDPRVHIVMPYHWLLDGASEEWKGKQATGSLKLGIGYCYEDKNNRLGIRFEDIINGKILAEKVRAVFPLKKVIIEKVFGQKMELTAKEIIDEYAAYGLKLKKYTQDVAAAVWHGWGKKKILFETAHGTFLDPAFGTYPYTVAPYSTAGALYSGVGIGPADIEVIGVVKAYTTRVGNGPFPTEQKNGIGAKLQKQGQEVGTTSGRKRRCGFLDLTMLRCALKLNSVNYLALTKLDVLSGFKILKIADHYLYQGKKVKYFPAGMNILNRMKPVYRTFNGWPENISQAKNKRELPENCRIYVDYIGRELDIPIKLISVSQDRENVIKI